MNCWRIMTMAFFVHSCRRCGPFARRLAPDLTPASERRALHARPNAILPRPSHCPSLTSVNPIPCPDDGVGPPYVSRSSRV